MDVKARDSSAAAAAAGLLIELAAMVPASYYILGSLLLLAAFLYGLLEFHFVGDILRGCRGNRVRLTFDPASDLCRHIVSKCRLFHSRYLVTPWLASPHVQTAFLHFFGNPPAFTYTRQVFMVSGEEAVGLDWLLPADVEGCPSDTKKNISAEETAPIVVVIPGLTSDSTCSYVRHLVHKIAKRGWNAVVCNHRGLGGIPVKSECYYNAGLTDDLRKVVDHLHQEYPGAPLFAVGTSLGANLLVKYLGEEGEDTPLSGAASICSPWDLLICDRFLHRNLVQKVYNKALAIALKDYAQLNQSIYSKLVDWESIRKARSVREFDSSATCLIMNYGTADTYYRRSSSAGLVGNVSVPLLCVSALDDPVCTKEAIPWDECRANKNIVLATTEHGGHLAFFRGIAGTSLWWVEAADEFLGVLHCSPFMPDKRKVPGGGSSDHTSAKLCREMTGVKGAAGEAAADGSSTVDGHTAAETPPAIGAGGQPEDDRSSEAEEEGEEVGQEEEEEIKTTRGRRSGTDDDDREMVARPAAARESRSRNRAVSRRASSIGPIWMLAYVAIVTAWPLAGPLLAMALFKRRRSKHVPGAALPWRHWIDNYLFK